MEPYLMMTRTELVSFISLGFFVFTVVVIRVGFFFGYSVSPLTLPLSFLWYSVMLLVGFLFSGKGLAGSGLVSLGVFAVIHLFLFLLSYPLGNTFDLSWDGQGYHQTAILALKEGWNPVMEAAIRLKQQLPSQIFAEGYPSALWEVQSVIYAITDRLNSAKVLNIWVALVSFGFVYAALRRMHAGKVVSVFTSALIVIQPVYMIQLLTYMQDGFGYQLVVIAVSTLVLTIKMPGVWWPAVAFMATGLLLVSTKYSHLPVAAFLGGIFILLIANRFLNHQMRFGLKEKGLALLFLIVTGTFMYLPYARNTIAHGYPFYPTNIPELMGSVTYNNVPHNLEKTNKAVKLFYGMFSRSQWRISGDPTHPSNVAELKVPFYFTRDEITDSASLFNNRVGAAGPLYSGLIVLSLVFLAVMANITRNRPERYVVYGTNITVGLILLLSLVAPTPNLIRYTSQLQLIPFVVLIPMLIAFKRPYMSVLSFAFLFMMGINALLYASAVIEYNMQRDKEVRAQFTQMRESGKTYPVKAQQFYSHYLLLDEQGIPYKMTASLETCQHIRDLSTSSNTTHFCDD